MNLIFCNNSFYTILVLFFITLNHSFTQIDAPLASNSLQTSYTDGSANDPIYVFCSSNLGGGQDVGELSTTPISGQAPYTFNWYVYDETFNGWTLLGNDNGTSSTHSNLVSGGYLVSIVDALGDPIGCHRAWVFVNTLSTDAGTDVATCDPFNLTGSNSAAEDFMYYNPPSNPLVIDNTTEIEVCFNATHTWVSDLGFYLVGPASAGSPVVELSPNPGEIDPLENVCNMGDDVVDLCFNSISTDILDVCENSPFTLTGTFGGFGVAGNNTLIDWSLLYGADAAAEGWTVQVYDCIGGDVGELTQATISFNGEGRCGPISTNYDSGTISSAIEDNSCDAATASIFVVPSVDYDDTPITLSNQLVSIAWLDASDVEISSTNSAAIASVPPTDSYYVFTATDQLGCTVRDTLLFTNTCGGCLIEEMNITLTPCDGNGNFSIDGDISFVDAPATGTLTLSDCNGNSTVLNAPFTSPAMFSITDIPADGAACDLTAVFSDDANCTQMISYTNVGDCGCPANVGTFTTLILGESSNNYVLCHGDTIASLSNGDYIPANDINDPATVAYDPGVSWFIYSCPPTVGLTPDPANPIVNDPCILGIISDFDFVDINDLFLIDQFPPGTFTDNIIYFVPITMYNITDAVYSFTYTGVPCYDMGDPVAVQYLPEITTNQQEDCVDGSLTVTVSGGFPELDGSQFTGRNLTPATASFLTGTGSNGGDIVVTGLNDGDAYSFEIVDANGCPVVIEGTFTGIEDPSFSYDASGYCQEEVSTTPSLTGTAGGTFTATPAGLSINATDGTIDLVNSIPGDYTVTYTTPSTVCGDASDVSLSVYPTPLFMVSGVAPTACGVADGFITLSGLVAGEQYQVGYSNDGAAVGPISLTADANGYVQITGLLPGTYGDIVVVSSNGCSVVNTNVVILEDLEAPFIDAGADASICIGESVTLTATNPEGANLTWTGNVQDGVAFTPTATSTTTYIVAAERDGCVSTDNVTVVVNPLPDVSAGQDVIVCSGYTVLLTAQGAATYTWDNGVQNSIPFVPTTTQMYTVTGTSAQGCSSEDSVLVTVEEVGAINFEADVLSGCVPVETTLNNLSTDPSLSCQWQVEGQTFTGCSDVNVMLNVAGCFDVTLQVTTANGCVGTETYEDYICVDPYPVASFEADPMQVNSIDPTVNFTNTSEGANLFEWYFGDGSDVTEEFSPSHDFPNSEGGSYVTRLIATSDAGCSDTTSVLIRVLEDLIFYVPNSFTPDGDEHNQSFQPVFTSGFDPYDYNLLIFNRWGEVVFESNDHRVGWDGSYGSESNQMVKEVTYVWKIEFKTVNTDERQVHTGHVTILR